MNKREEQEMVEIEHIFSRNPRGTPNKPQFENTRKTPEPADAETSAVFAELRALAVKRGDITGHGSTLKKSLMFVIRDNQQKQEPIPITIK
jgi:hypothetical protein